MTAPPADPTFLVVATVLLFLLILGYLWFVYVVGPKVMKEKAPYTLTNLIRVYNIFQITACTAFVVRSYQMGFDFRFIWRCEKFDWLSDEAKVELYIGTWLFLLLRIFEFIETILFILRKKNNQASFLHVYHHVSTVLLMWVFITFDTGEDFVFFSFLDELMTQLILNLFLLQSLWRSTMLRSTVSCIA